MHPAAPSVSPTPFPAARIAQAVEGATMAPSAPSPEVVAALVAAAVAIILLMVYTIWLRRRP